MTTKEQSLIQNTWRSVDDISARLNGNIEALTYLRSLLQESLSNLSEENIESWAILYEAEKAKRNLYIFNELSNHIINELKQLESSLDSGVVDLRAITVKAIAVEA